jgi:2-amino-4-hydroxy-6-hydroxymethyldihydropteridine diphosphokinase
MEAAQAVGALRMSSVYETAPQGEVTDQPDFLNAVVEIETELGPEDLLAECKRIES